jgi:hypothetical protein
MSATAGAVLWYLMINGSTFEQLMNGSWTPVPFSEYHVTHSLGECLALGNQFKTAYAQDKHRTAIIFCAQVDPEGVVKVSDGQ